MDPDTFIPQKKSRVIIDTDAKNEADDQYAIVQTLLTSSFDLHGVISAQFGTRKSATSEQDSYDEIVKLFDLMQWKDRGILKHGAAKGMTDEHTPSPSEGAQLIVDEALKDDPRPLHVAFFGPLTEMASALLMEPKINTPKIRCVWIGGGEWPVGGAEYNLSNDIAAANVVFRSQVEVWQIPSSVYRQMPVSYAELFEKVYPYGELGRYLVEQLVEWNEKTSSVPIEHRSLGDSPAVGVMMYPNCGRWHWQPAPEFETNMYYRHTGLNRPIKVYETIDARFIHEDFFAKLARWARTNAK